MSKNSILKVQGKDINITQVNEKDFISLTDIVSAMDGAHSLIGNWMSNKNTIEFLGLWEGINNEHFNFTGFHEVKNEAGANRYMLSVKKWAEQTNAIGIISKSGRHGGGTYAHEEIALEFCAWLSPAFKLYLVKEFKRLKEAEGSNHNVEWNVKRVLSKANYHIHTSAIKEYRVPKENLPKDKEGIIYADEAELLNYAVFGFTSKAWREENPELVLKGHNLREYASINELAILSNMESINAVMLGAGVDRKTRAQQLRILAKKQLEAISNIDFEKSYRKTVEGNFQNKIDKSIKVKSLNQLENNNEVNFNGSFGDAISKIAQAGKPKE